MEYAIGYTIRKLRKPKFRFAADLADDVPISRAYLCEIERGEKAPSFAMLNDIARSLEMKPADLLRSIAESLDELQR